MRKKLGILFFMVSIVFFLAAIGYSLRGSRYNDFIRSTSEYDTIKRQRLENPLWNIELFFDEQQLLYEKGTKTYYYSIIDEEKTAYNPIVKIRATEGKLNICICENEMDDILIGNNVQTKFLIYSDEYFAEYNLITTKLPLMNINCDEEIIGDVDMSISLFDNRKGCSNRQIYSDGKIRWRGASSKEYPKKSYRISLLANSVGENERPNNISLLGMRKDDDWILYAAYNDQEKIRNVFSQNLWKYSCANDNEYGIDAGVEYKYIELFINNEYCGLYALGYPIDDKQLGLRRNMQGDTLVMKNMFESIPFVDDNGQFTIIGYEIKNGEPDDSTKWKSLLTYYENLYKNRDDSEELLKCIDKNNAIDIFLFTNLIQGIDNVRGGRIKNMYMSLRTEENGMTSMYIPWDMDMTWGNTWIHDLSINFTKEYDFLPDHNQIMESGYLNQIIVNNDTGIWDDIYERYWNLRNDAWSEEKINALLIEYENDIFNSGAYLREMQRWPDGTYQAPELKLSVFREYVVNRLKALDQYMLLLKEHSDWSLFKRRSLQYAGFLQSDFMIEMKDESRLNDGDYTDLLEYMNVDISKITNGIHYIIGNPTKGYSYYKTQEDFDERGAIMSGEIMKYIEYDDEDIDADIRMCFVNNNRGYTFNFEKDFDIYEYEE